MGFHGHSALQDSVKATDIERRSQNSYTAPSHSVVSHEALIGVLGFLPTTHAEANANKMHPWSSHTIQPFRHVYLRSRNSYTAPSYGVISHGALIGVLGFLPTTHAETTQTKSVHDLHAPYGLSGMSIFTLKPQYVRTWQITVILIRGKTWIPPLWTLCRNKDGAGCRISGLYLWSKHKF